MLQFLAWFIIDALAFLIVGGVSGLLLGTHLARGHFTHFLHTDALPQPQTKTQALMRPSLPRLSRNSREYPGEEEQLYY